MHYIGIPYSNQHYIILYQKGCSVITVPKLQLKLWFLTLIRYIDDNLQSNSLSISISVQKKNKLTYAVLLLNIQLQSSCYMTFRIQWIILYKFCDAGIDEMCYVHNKQH